MLPPKSSDNVWMMDISLVESRRICRWSVWSNSWLRCDTIKDFRHIFRDGRFQNSSVLTQKMWHIELHTVHNFGPKFSCWRQTLQFQRKIGIVNFLCSVPFNGFPFCSFLFVFCVFVKVFFVICCWFFSARRIGLYEEKPLTASFSGKQFDVTESLNGGPTWRCPYSSILQFGCCLVSYVQVFKTYIFSSATSATLIFRSQLSINFSLSSLLLVIDHFSLFFDCSISGSFDKMMLMKRKVHLQETGRVTT